MMALPANRHHCDVLVVGSGAAGFAAAITARKAGLDVLLVEKSGCFGGTSAISGGYIWIPNNALARAAGMADSPEKAREYLRSELGERYNDAFIEAYLDHGPRMVDFLVNDLGIPFSVSTQMPDYHPDATGSTIGRSLHVKPVNGRILGKEFRRLRPLPRELSLFGMGVSSGSDLSHLYKFGRSLDSTARVFLLLARYAIDVFRFGRGRQLTNGNALVARLAKALLFDLQAPVWTSAPVTRLLYESGRIAGAIVAKNGQPVEVRADRGVVLASGGFAHDVERRTKLYPHPAGLEEHVSLAAPGNTGDGARMAEAAGGHFDADVINAAAWMPLSRVPRPDGSWGPILHSVNLGKPGVIAVLRNGKRFVNESLSYHDFVQALISLPDIEAPVGAFVVCDHRAFGKYGLGYAKPFLPLQALIDTGYLIRADTAEELARATGIEPVAFVQTLRDFNAHAVHGDDPGFGKGGNAYARFLGDMSHTPNPCVAPIDQAPYYAVWMYAGDIGSFAGIKTDPGARVMRSDGTPVPGLFAIGNDMASAFSGCYPGGGTPLGLGMTFGYIAGRILAEEKLRT
jgi:succinate dehydrogenase/fumarate reductase flavoprotein subunit